MNTRFVALLTCVLLGSSLPTFAQEDVLYPWPSTFSLLLGFEVGPNFSIFNQTITHSPIQNPTSPAAVLKSGSGLGGFGSLILEYPIGNSMGLRLEGGLDYTSFTMSGEGIADCPQVGGNPFDTVSMGVKQTASALWLRGGLMFRADIGGGFFALVGPVYQKRISDVSVDTRLEILTPGTCVFMSSGNKISETSSSSSSDFTSTRWGLEGGIGYREMLSSNLWLTVTGRMQYIVTPLTPDGEFGVDYSREKTIGLLDLIADNRTLHSIKLSVGLMWRP